MAKGKSVSPSVTAAGTYIELVAGKLPKEHAWHPPAQYQSVEMPVEEPPGRHGGNGPTGGSVINRMKSHMGRARGRLRSTLNGQRSSMKKCQRRELGSAAWAGRGWGDHRQSPLVWASLTAAWRKGGSVP